MQLKLVSGLLCTYSCLDFQTLNHLAFMAGVLKSSLLLTGNFAISINRSALHLNDTFNRVALQFPAVVNQLFLFFSVCSPRTYCPTPKQTSNS